MENKELLYSLYKVYSPSRGEKKMRKFIKDYIKRNIPGVVLDYDSTGNIYATKGVSDSYPCVVSHIDQVQKTHGKDFMCIEVNGRVFGFSPSTMEMRGLGADDKNGIWVCLQVLAKFDTMKCAFFVGEEIGCVGSSDAKMDFFDDCRYVLQCDRRNGGDLITSIWGDLCSEEFLADIDYADFGYNQTDGLTTDVGTLKDNGLKVSCVNMSCGYYNPHTDEEWTNLAELENCLHFVEHIVEKCDKVYPHEMTHFSKYGGYDAWDGDDLFPRSYYGGVGGWRSYSGKSGVSYPSGSGTRKWVWDEKNKCYDFIEVGGGDEEVAQDDHDSRFDEEWDDINSQILSDLWDNMEDKDIITDIQYYYPLWGADILQEMINDVRNSYSFRHFS